MEYIRGINDKVGNYAGLFIGAKLDKITPCWMVRELFKEF